MPNPYSLLDVGSDDESNAKATQKKQPKKKESKKVNAKPREESKPEAPKPGGRAAARGGKTRFVDGRDKRGKREFERRSGQKSYDVDRKGGAGGYNWGVPGEEAGEEVQENGNAENEDGSQADVPQEPEVVEKTIEEYYAEREAKRQGEAFQAMQGIEVEKVSEGKEYAKKDPLKLEEEEAFMAGSTKTKRVRDRKKEKAVVETSFTVKDNTEPESGFRGRGRGRGAPRGRGFSRGRGGLRGAPRGRATGRGRGRGFEGKIDTNNAADFPALGS